MRWSSACRSSFPTPMTAGARTPPPVPGSQSQRNPRFWSSRQLLTSVHILGEWHFPASYLLSCHSPRRANFPPEKKPVSSEHSLSLARDPPITTTTAIQHRPRHEFTMSHGEDKADQAVDSAPDLQILGDEITLQPSGFVEPSKEAPEGKEQALMDRFASFRSEPLQYDHSRCRQTFPHQSFTSLTRQL